MARTSRQVKSFVSSLPTEYLNCRQYGHAWAPYTVEVARGTYLVQLSCSRCDGIQKVTLGRTGDVAKQPRRSYPDGYLAQGLGRLDGSARSAIRLENVKRLLDSLSTDQSNVVSLVG